MRENDIPETTDVLRSPTSLYQVTDNAIASAVMREPLEMIVTAFDGQLQISQFALTILTPVCRSSISGSLFHRRGSIAYVLATSRVTLLKIPHPQSGLHTAWSVQT